MSSDIIDIYGRCAAIQSDSVNLLRGMTVRVRHFDQTTRKFSGTISELLAENASLKNQLSHMVALEGMQWRVNMTTEQLYCFLIQRR